MDSQAPASPENENSLDADIEANVQYSPNTRDADGTGKSPQVEEIPDRIGRYAIQRVLGTGGFGRVFLANDVELKRLVAVKVPYRKSLDALSSLDEFLDEAHILASLDHAHIVPVYDVGRSDEQK